MLSHMFGMTDLESGWRYRTRLFPLSFMGKALQWGRRSVFCVIRVIRGSLRFGMLVLLDDDERQPWHKIEHEHEDLIDANERI